MTNPSFAGRLRAFGGANVYVTRLLVILAALVVFFAIVRPSTFLSLITWQSMAIQFPEFGLMALGVMLTMLTGGIDLSVVGIANMSAISAAVLMLSMSAGGSSATVAITASVLLAVAIGVLAGALNGLLVSRVKIPPILVTLGTFELFTGIAIVITGGRPKSGLPMQYSELVAGKAFGVIPVQLLIFVAAALVVAFLMNRTSYGTKLYMLGTNPTAAVFSGLRTNRLLIKTYVLSGLWAAIAGLVMLANYNSAKPDYGASYTLLTVLIVVLGGVNPYGGKGKLMGVVLAIVILQILSSGLNLFPNISNFYRPLIWGAVLLVVVATSDSAKRGLRRIRKKPVVPLDVEETSPEKV